jgi:hypothetical protein
VIAAATASLLVMAGCGSGAQTNAPSPSSSTTAHTTAAAPDNVANVITGLEQQWVKAMAAKDTTTIDRLIDNDFIGPTTDIQYGKRDAIMDVNEGTHESLDLSNVVVHVFGDAAVVTMDQNEKSRHGTEDFPHGVFTDSRAASCCRILEDRFRSASVPAGSASRSP